MKLKLHLTLLFFFAIISTAQAQYGFGSHYGTGFLCFDCDYSIEGGPLVSNINGVKANERVGFYLALYQYKEINDQWALRFGLGYANMGANLKENSENFVLHSMLIEPISVHYTFKKKFKTFLGGTLGELDLWRVAILEDGKTFGTPENLGAHINTGFNERYPFISADRILYFTSDRWGGYGGLDIYALDLKDDTAQPKNLGEGINTPKDDFNFVYNSTLDYGFLSTNRIGRQDIYRVKPKCDVEVKGVVRDAETQAKLTEATVVLVDASRQVLARLQTDREGQFTAVLPCDKTYQIQVVQEGYYDKEEEHRTPKEAEAVLNISLKKQQKLHIQDNKILVNDIPFAFDQATITTEGARELDRLVALMVENKTMRILIVAHTDRVGKEKYNKKLAQARAKATAQYLFDHGIAQDRVEAKGVGSSEPKVDCSTCTEFEDQQNRRSEFIILQP